jgi:RNA polymerase sigma-70 factor, ECF subfamily
VKAAQRQLHSPVVEQLLATEHALEQPASSLPQTIEVLAVYREHADFLWRSLQHMGIGDADLEDAVQEVLVVVHRRRRSYNFECRLTTWLFGICLRVASRHRRRAHFRWERPTDCIPEPIEEHTPEDHLAEQRAQAQLERLLSSLSPEHRAAFLLFEVEGQSCQEIADLCAVPVGTIYSRLHAARTKVNKALERERRSIAKGNLR